MGEKKPDNSNSKKGQTYPEMADACLVCHGHGQEILEDLTYCRCRRCGGSGVDPKVDVPNVPKSAYITLEERLERMKKYADKRNKELKEEKKKDGPSRGKDGMSDLEC